MKKDYEVGYGRPPKEHQFRKGKSGNPAGRPKRRPEPKPSEAALLMQEMSAETVTIQGRDYQKMDALLRTLYAQAMKSPAAMRLFLQTMEKLGLLKPIDTVERGGGVLVVPGTMPLDRWTAAAALQQADFRGDNSDVKKDA